MQNASLTQGMDAPEYALGQRGREEISGEFWMWWFCIEFDPIHLQFRFPQ